jgi:hypothetical protein
MNSIIFICFIAIFEDLSLEPDVPTLGKKGIGIDVGIAIPEKMDNFKKGFAIGVNYNAFVESDALCGRSIISFDYNKYTNKSGMDNTVLCFSAGGRLFLPIGFIRPYFMASALNLYIVKMEEETLYKYGFKFGFGVEIEIMPRLFINIEGKGNLITGNVENFQVYNGGINVCF